MREFKGFLIGSLKSSSFKRFTIIVSCVVAFSTLNLLVNLSLGSCATLREFSVDHNADNVVGTNKDEVALVGHSTSKGNSINRTMKLFRVREVK
jgi:hypothetical protein